MHEIGIVFLTWRRKLQKELLPYGITLKQYFLLGRLARKEFLLPSEVADQLFCDRPTASVIIRNMERSGWIRKVKDPGNGRQVRLFLTEAGQRKRNQVREVLSVYEDDVFPCFSDEEHAVFDSLLVKLKNYIDGDVK